MRTQTHSLARSLSLSLSLSLFFLSLSEYIIYEYLYIYTYLCANKPTRSLALSLSLYLYLFSFFRSLPSAFSLFLSFSLTLSLSLSLPPSLSLSRIVQEKDGFMWEEGPNTFQPTRQIMRLAVDLGIKVYLTKIPETCEKTFMISIVLVGKETNEHAHTNCDWPLIWESKCVPKRPMTCEKRHIIFMIWVGKLSEKETHHHAHMSFLCCDLPWFGNQGVIFKEICDV